MRADGRARAASAPSCRRSYGGLGLAEPHRRRDHRGDRAAATSTSPTCSCSPRCNGQILARHAAPELARQWLARIDAGRGPRVAIALTEPRGGSDAGQPAPEGASATATTTCSTARRPRSRWPTRPTPPWSSRAPARVEDGAQRRHAPSSCRWTCRASHARASTTSASAAIGRGSMFFDDVRVPVEPSARRRGQGLRAGDAGLRLQPRADRAAVPRRSRRPSLDETWAYVQRARGLRQAAVGIPGRDASRWPNPRRSRRCAPAVLSHAVAQGRGAPHTAEAAMCKWWAPKLAFDVIHQCLLTHGHGG